MYMELLNLYTKHGFYKEHLISVVKKGIDGANEIAQIMTNMRQNPITEMHGEKVEFLYDYENSVCKNLLTNEETVVDLPKSNVLIYKTVNGTRVAARPSGTEPKIKFYFSVHTPLNRVDNAKKVEETLDNKIKMIIEELNL